MSLNSAVVCVRVRDLATSPRVGASQGTVRVYALNYATLANFEMR